MQCISHNVYTSSVYGRLYHIESTQPTARSLRFGGAIIRKKSAGRRLRRRPCIYVIVAGSDGARIKRSMSLPLLYRLTPNTLPAEKKRKASANKLPAGRFFFFTGNSSAYR